MNIETSNNQHEILTVGIYLKKARERLGLSQKIVAKRLYLKVSVIQLIEEDQLPANLSLTFFRGYILSYAKLLHLTEEELLPMIKKQILSKTSKISLTQNSPLEKCKKKYDNYIVILTYVILSITAGLTSVWWWQNYKEQQKEISIMANQLFDKMINNVKINSLTKNIKLTISDIQFISNKQIKDQINRLETSTQTTYKKIKDEIFPKLEENFNFIALQQKKNFINSPYRDRLSINQVNTLISDLDSSMLFMNFTNDCWLKVTDSTKKKLFMGLKNKNSNLNLVGRAPYKLKIGAPAAIEIYYRGKHIDLSQFIKSKQIAHLTLNDK